MVDRDVVGAAHDVAGIVRGSMRIAAGIVGSPTMGIGRSMIHDAAGIGRGSVRIA